MPCKTCSHPQRPAIDLALLVGNHTFETLSHLYGLTVSSLFRHKKHLVEKTVQARQRLRDSQAQVSLLKLNAYLEQVQRAVQTAEAQGNINLVLKGAQIGSRIIRQISQMEVPLELDTVYRLISSPQWVSQDSLLPTDPQIINAIHQAVTDTALTPCPDEEPETIPEDLSSPPLETPNPELDTPQKTELLSLETPNPDLETSLLLQELLADLLTAAGIDPKNQREKSAKSPKNLPHLTENNKIYQIDNTCSKNFPKNPLPVPSSLFPGASPTENQEPATRDDPPPAHYPEDYGIVPLKTDRYRRRGIF